MSREQRESIVYAACDLIREHMPTICEIFIESVNWRRDHPDALVIHSNDEVKKAAEAIDVLEQKVKALKTG